MTTYSMLIGGQLHSGSAQMDVINPATAQPFATAPRAAQSDLDAAVTAARAAYPAWAATPLDQRRAVVRAMGDVMATNAEELAQLFTREQGRPLAGARNEIVMAADWFRTVAESEIPVEVTEDSARMRAEVHHDPLGVVAAIVPWNFPVNLAVWKIAPALLTGNCMVLKPSPFTPLTMLRFGELVKDIVPAGVLNIITGGDELGPWMTAHEGFDKISFTGSSATGRKVMETAAKDLRRITLELGGNDAAIVMPDIDLDSIAPRIFFGSFFNSAQICIATKRLYVHDAIYDALRDRLVAMAKGSPLGDGAVEGTAFGPIQNKPQYDRVMALLEDAKAQGLNVITCSEVPQEGYFVPLTIVDNPPEDSRVVQEEAFGPILPMIRFTDLDDVIAKANDSEYGLAGSVWAGDVELAGQIARRLDSGTVWINHSLGLLPSTPFAGRRQSGLGVENGRDGLLEFTQRKAIYTPKAKA